MARKPTRKTLVRQLDDVTRKIIRIRDEFKCQRCGSPGKGKQCPDWAHIYGGRRYYMRWDFLNAILLCAGCHRWWHDNPRLAKDWFDARWPHRAGYLEAKFACGPQPVRDWELAFWLKEAREKLSELKGEYQ